MSLLNKMLQDIEKRHPKQDDVSLMSHLSNNVSSAAKKDKHVSPVFLWMMILLTLIGVSLFLGVRIFQAKHIYDARQKAKTSAMVVQKSANPNTVTVKSTEEVRKVTPLSKSQVLGVTVTQSENKSIVSVSLSQEVHYQMQISKDGEQIILDLPDAVLKEPLPSVIQDSIVKTVKADVESTGLKLVFSVWSHTQVDKIGLIKGESPKIELTLSNDKLLQSQMHLEKVSDVPDPDEVAAQHYQYALNLINNNQIDKAISVLQETVLEKPDYKDARESLVVLFLQEQRFDDAEKYLKTGFQQLPGYIPYIELQARLFLAEGKSDDALSLLQQHSPSMRDYPDYYATLAALYQKAKNYSASVELYGRLLTINNMNSKWWLGLAIGFERLHDNNAAIEAYRRAVLTGGLTPDMLVYVNQRIQILGG